MKLTNIFLFNFCLIVAITLTTSCHRIIGSHQDSSHQDSYGKYLSIIHSLYLRQDNRLNSVENKVSNFKDLLTEVDKAVSLLRLSLSTIEGNEAASSTTLGTLNDLLAAASDRINALENPPAPEPPACPEDTEEIDSICYSMSSMKADLFGARSECEMQGGYLATVTPTVAAVTALLTALRSTFTAAFVTLNSDINDSFIRVDGIEVGGTNGDGDFIYQKNGVIILNEQTDILTRTVSDIPESLSLTPNGDATTMNQLSAIGNSYSTYFLCQYDKV